MSRPKKVPYYKKPEDVSIEQWQIALRRQFALDQNFEVKNKGYHPVFSDFEVFNPNTNKTYKVAIRNNEFGMNFCSCPDFKINGLSTCKHIEYVLYKLKNNKENQKYFDSELILPYSSLSLRYEKERKLFLRVGYYHADKLKEIAKNYFNEEGYLLSGSIDKLEEFFQKTSRIEHDFRIYPDVVEFLNRYKADKYRQNQVDEIFSEGISSPAFNNLVKTNLYPYQKEAVIKALKVGRVLIADEMGLGKTIQAIAATEIFATEFNVNRVLIVCPTSLKYQWKNEIEKFTDKSVKVVEGVIKKRKEAYKAEAFYKIINYNVIKNDIGYIDNLSPDLVIIDEAQRIKNWKTQTAQNVKKISSPFAIVLTGTPLENRLEELHSIVEFIDRYKLGALFRFLYTHQITDEFGKVIGYKELNRINETLRPVLIRRTREEIKDQLPDRIDKTMFVDMTKEQIKYHNDYYDIVCRLVNKWRSQGYLNEEDRNLLQIALNCMRMLCDSTYVLDQKTRHDTKIDEILFLISDILETQTDKVVIFSQWKRMLTILAEELEQNTIRFEFLHGNVHSSGRNEMINRFFNDSETRVFLSTDAGGVGINLQAASIVINIDIPWNPAVLEQRIGRAYRLGQKRHVRVINLVSRGTIEHRILYLLQFKKAVFDGVIDNGEDTVLIGIDRFTDLMKSLEQLMDKNMEYITPYTPEKKFDKKMEICNQPVDKLNEPVAADTEMTGDYSNLTTEQAGLYNKISGSRPGIASKNFIVGISSGIKRFFKRVRSVFRKH